MPKAEPDPSKAYFSGGNVKIITISGEIGSGKSTIARALAGVFGVDLLSTGSIQRQLAARRGLSTLEYNLLSEKQPELDREIDEYTTSLQNSAKPVVVDSRMAWYFLPDSFKVYLIVDPIIAAGRVHGDELRKDTEQHESLEAARAEISQRFASEKKRFQELYDVDFSDFSSYDVVIDTSHATPEEVSSLIVLLVTRPRHSMPSLWLSPKRLYPTQHVRELRPSAETSRRYVDPSPVRVISFEQRYFILDGHKRVSAALRHGRSLVPATVSHSDREAILPGLSVREFLKDHSLLSWIYDWEDSTTLDILSIRSQPESRSLKEGNGLKFAGEALRCGIVKESTVSFIPLLFYS